MKQANRLNEMRDQLDAVVLQEFQKNIFAWYSSIEIQHRIQQNDLFKNVSVNQISHSIRRLVEKGLLQKGASSRPQRYRFIVQPEPFVEKIWNARELVYEDEKGTKRSVQVRPARYAGARFDRLRDRNRITRGLGFPALESGEFWSLDFNEHEGVFLADVLAACARGKEKLWADGELVEIKTSFRYEGSCLVFSA